MFKAKVNGININYEVRGNGVPVTFLHGFGGTLDTWRYQREVFSREYQFIACDLRGHGASDSPRSLSQYSADIAVEDIIRLLDILSVEKTVVCGHSMGGYLALRLALSHPRRVMALVLIGAGPGFRNPIQRDVWNQNCEKYAEVLEKQGLTAFRNRFPGFLDGSEYDAIGLANVARAIMRQRDSFVIDHLDHINIPTLILVGEKDRSNTIAGKFMAKSIPGALHITVPKAGHTVSLNNPEEFNKVVLDFLKCKLPKLSTW